ncbi:pyruvate formate-lyase-activating protein [Ammoniphilus sp. CFH 90114]|uniref:pyruvate formate-lyase-activating protein n=1 Tax=Ammoniphilus sp. CFH 90114 TaxID=2493665 RepID=UPI00100E5177|nr:pyruvate formate-lyase-activating protein [Ammoniphilus sp. CFH 90114]RXT06418.1 pyruvate formate lyase-activating protein [Ammoniphilus sp. CFH 90114]
MHEIGHIHSIETMGMVDGPGIRYIVFMQGCLLRCQYCHNPDTWDIGKGRTITVEELVSDIKAYFPFMKASGGGITVSGGEPLLQAAFLAKLFKECKKLGIHTCIDSSGGCFSHSLSFLDALDSLLLHTDLVLLDIKHIYSDKHKQLTGLPNEHILEFARYLSNKEIPVWIRHVLVPGITDAEEDLKALSAFIGTLNNVERVEVLPYHEMGVHKWEHLGLPYTLKDISPPTEEAVKKAQQILGSSLP